MCVVWIHMNTSHTAYTMLVLSTDNFIITLYRLASIASCLLHGKLLRHALYTLALCFIEGVGSEPCLHAGVCCMLHCWVKCNFVTLYLHTTCPSVMCTEMATCYFTSVHRTLYLLSLSWTFWFWQLFHTIPSDLWDSTVSIGFILHNLGRSSRSSGYF